LGERNGKQKYGATNGTVVRKKTKRGAVREKLHNAANSFRGVVYGVRGGTFFEGEEGRGVPPGDWSKGPLAQRKYKGSCWYLSKTYGGGEKNTKGGGG